MSRPRLYPVSSTMRVQVGVGAVASVGPTGDSYDNPLAEAFNSLFKAKLIRNEGPWKKGLMQDRVTAAAQMCLATGPPHNWRVQVVRHFGRRRRRDLDGVAHAWARAWSFPARAGQGPAGHGLGW